MYILSLESIHFKLEIVKLWKSNFTNINITILVISWFRLLFLLPSVFTDISDTYIELYITHDLHKICQSSPQSVTVCLSHRFSHFWVTDSAIPCIYVIQNHLVCVFSQKIKVINIFGLPLNYNCGFNSLSYKWFPQPQIKYRILYRILVPYVIG